MRSQEVHPPKETEKWLERKGAPEGLGSLHKPGFPFMQASELQTHEEWVMPGLGEGK